MPPTRRGPKKAPATPPEPDARARLIAAGYRVLAERGYDETTVKEVAREAGVNQGLVHYYFGSKDALLLAVTKEASLQYTAELRVLRGETPPERLAAASFAWGERLLKDAPEKFRLNYELFALGLRNKELKPAVAELQRHAVDEVARTVARARGGDEARPEVVDFHYAAVMKACVDGLALSHLLDEHFDPAPVYALLSRMVLGSQDFQAASRPPPRKPKSQARRGKPAPRPRAPRPAAGRPR